MVHRTTYLFILMCFAGIWSLSAYGDQVMKPVLDAFGKETGSYNVNPDPNGEPWIVTPLKMTPERKAMLDALPEWKPEKPLAKSASLPKAVNHFKEPEFRPIFSQKGGSCSAASGTGYVYTWEANILTGASGQDHRAMYYYGYNFLNRGSTSSGIWWYDAWDIMKSTGCVREADWPSRLGSETGTEWANTYAAYHNANFDRCSTYYKITQPGTAAGLEKCKRWMYDHGRGDPKGGMLEMNAGINFGIQTIPSGSAEAGSKIATQFDGPNTIHAMCYAGYNDDVYYNSSNKGALLLVNSWGTSFGDRGILWIPYNLFTNETEVYCMEVVKHIPRLEFKVSLQGYGKTGGSFTSGFATSATASSPTTTQTYPDAFTGNTGTFTGEIGLDITKAWPTFSGNSASGKFFLQSRGSGTVSSLSLMIYDNTGKTLLNEIRCSQTNVSIGTTMTIVVENAVGVADPLVTMPPKTLSMRKAGDGYLLYIPFKGNSTVTVSDLGGRVLASFASSHSDWYGIPANVRSGVHFVTVNHDGKRFVRKLSAVK
ncbi:MAG: hypothetical protein JXA71_19375 [Chitinispirillaceae bacterium]|nr:hypothetical protein [Chitinispirillaceae bacterium]